jgi:menaquinone-specific isochorismate synthase
VSAPAREPVSLVARTVALDPGAAVDLLAFAGDDGLLFSREDTGLAGRGIALRIPVPGGCSPEETGRLVADALDGIDVDDDVERPGTGAVAIGALPFDAGIDGELVVPSTIVGRAADGTAWVTHIAPPGTPAPALELAPASERRPPDGFALTSTMSHADFCDIVASTVKGIADGCYEKVVLAREVQIEASGPILVADVLSRLRALFPACMVFSVDGFVGASPELLLRRFGTEVCSHPLAGTVPRSGDPEADDRLAAGLLGSPKDRHEHRVVVDAVASTLGPLCADLDVPDGPSIVPLRNVSHLGTLITGHLRAPAAGALELAARLHPTPAVAGTPREAALERIAEVEGFDRGRYAGPVGWVDGNGDGEWAVGIRSATHEGNHARLVAGVGVVADSDPEAELAETQLKLQALLAAVVRP